MRNFCEINKNLCDTYRQAAGAINRETITNFVNECKIFQGRPRGVGPRVRKNERLHLDA